MQDNSGKISYVLTISEKDNSLIKQQSIAYVRNFFWQMNYMFDFSMS